MGYTTHFKGRFELNKHLAEAHRRYLKQFNETRRMKRDPKRAETLPDPLRLAVGLPVGDEAGFFVGGTGSMGQDHDFSITNYNNAPEGQPGLWCQWTPNEDGTHIEWDGGEKFYEYTAWLLFIVEKFLKPWGYVLNGRVTWQGQDRSDAGCLEVVDNNVMAHMVPVEFVEVTATIPKKLLDSYKEQESEDDAFEIADIVIEAYEG